MFRRVVRALPVRRAAKGIALAGGIIGSAAYLFYQRARQVSTVFSLRRLILVSQSWRLCGMRNLTLVLPLAHLASNFLGHLWQFETEYSSLPAGA